MTGRPNLDGVYGVTANPVRLIYMIGLLWRLAHDLKKDSLDLLEIGSWCGASALAWGDGIRNYFGGRGRITCVDAWASYIDTDANADGIGRFMEAALSERQPYEVFLGNMKFLPPEVGFDIRRGLSQDVLPTLPRATFDLVYIDGDHVYDVVATDIANAIPLVRDGGVICGDDLELQSDECDVSIVDREPGVEIARDGRSGREFHPGVTKAVGERFGHVPCWHGFWAMQKRADEWLPILLDGMPVILPSHIPPIRLAELKLFLMREGLF